MGLVDPDGMEIWKPDTDGNIIAEKGDNKETLSAFLNCSIEEASAILNEQGYNSNITIAAGSKVKLDNVYTRSIVSYSDNERYNCWGSARAGVCGINIQSGVEIPYATLFDYILSNEFENIDAQQAKFGKTIIRFESESLYLDKRFDKDEKSHHLSRQPGTIGSTSHAAVYYGTSNDGTVFVYTKNGYSSKPKVVPLKTLEGYGKVRGIGGTSGYYNYRY